MTKLIVPTLLVALLSSSRAFADYEPRFIDASEAKNFSTADPLAYPYFANTKEALNKAQGTWIFEMTNLFTQVIQPYGESRKGDEIIRQKHGGLLKLIPSLHAPEEQRQLRDQLTRGFYDSSVKAPEKPFFAESVAVEKWLCIVARSGVCEILQILPGEILRTQIVHRPRAHFQSDLIPEAGEFSPTSSVFEGLYPGDVLQFDGLVYGMEHELSSNPNRLKPRRIFFEKISNLTSLETGFHVTENLNDNFKVQKAALSVDGIFKLFNPNFSSPEQLKKKGYSEQMAQLFANYQQFKNQEQGAALGKMILHTSILLQEQGKSRALDMARTVSQKILSEKMPALLGATEKKQLNGSPIRYSVADQILNTHSVSTLGMPAFAEDEAAKDWICIIRTEADEKGNCDIIYFGSNGRIYKTRVALRDRLSAAKSPGGREGRNYKVFEDFYPGEVIRFDGKYIGFSFYRPETDGKAVYPSNIYFSEVSNARLEKLPFEIARIDEYGFQIRN